jgi:hypothetical protein
LCVCIALRLFKTRTFMEWWSCYFGLDDK